MEEIPQRVMSGRFTRRLRNIRLNQWIWGGSWVILAAGFAVVPEIWIRVVAALFLVIGIWGAWPYSYGPLFTYIPEYRATRAIRRRKGRVAREARPGSRRRNTQHAPIDVQIAAFPTTQPDRSSLATFYSPGRNCDTSITVGKAWQGSNLEPFQRLNAEDGFANAILDVANMTTDSIGLTLGLHKGPVNIWESRNWAADNFHENVKRAGRLDFDERPPTNVYERQSADFSDTDLRRRLFTRDVTAFVGLNVQRPDDFKAIREGVRKGEITAKEFERRVLISRMTRRLEQNLRIQGVSDVESLDEMGMRTFAQSSWNLDIEEWYDYLQDPSSRPPVDDKRSILHKDPYWPWPLDEPLALIDDTGKPYLDLGGSKHRIARATRMNETVFPGEFKPLYVSGDIGLANETSLTVSMSGDTFPVSKESKALNYAIVLQEAFNGMFLSDDAVRSLEEQEKIQELRDRQDKLYRGGKQGINYNLWTAWGASDLATLQEVDEIVAEHARSCDIHLRFIPWESRMIKAKFTASIGASLM